MNLTELILLGFALGIDCMVASFAQGVIFTKHRRKNSFALASSMGVFQGGMPFIGYFATDYVRYVISPFSKLIVFFIFFLLGMKFIFDAFQPKEDVQCCIGLKCLIGLGIATSIDALVSGVTLNLTSTNVLYAGLIIGIISFVMSMVGFWGGNLLKIFPPKYMEISGGLILIFLAVKSIFN